MPPCLGSHGNKELRHESLGLEDLNPDPPQSGPFLLSPQFRQGHPGQGRVHMMREPPEPPEPEGQVGEGGSLCTETQEQRQEMSSS